MINFQTTSLVCPQYCFFCLSWRFSVLLFTVDKNFSTFFRQMMAIFRCFTCVSILFHDTRNMTINTNCKKCRRAVKFVLFHQSISPVPKCILTLRRLVGLNKLLCITYVLNCKSFNVKCH